MSQGCGCYSRKCSFECSLWTGTQSGREGSDHTEVLTGLWMSTESSQLNHKISSRPKHTLLLHGHSATLPMQELTLFLVWAEQHHPIAPTSTRRLPSSPMVLSITLVYSSWRWHGPTFDFLPCPQTHLVGFKGHTEWGTCPPIISALL